MWYAGLRIHECLRIDSAAARAALEKGVLLVPGPYGRGREVPINETIRIELKHSVTKSTYRAYRGNMENHIIPYFKELGLKLQETKSYHLEDYYKYKVSEHVKGRKPLSAETVRHHHQNISKALNDAVRHEILPFNPTHNAKPPKPVRFVGSYLNPKQIQKMLALFRGSPVERPSSLSRLTACFVFTLEDGTPISPNYLTRKFHNTLKDSDLPTIRLHDLRHSTATNLLANHFSVVDVQHWLGHSQPSTTLNFYSHVDATSKQNISKALEKIIPLEKC